MSRAWPPPIVVSAEHASCRVPKALHWLGLPPATFERHVGWDPGAAFVARALAKVLGAPLHLGKWSRLVADLNRSARHPRVIAGTVDKRPIPGNRLDAEAHAARLSRYWQPYRDAVSRDVESAIAAHGVCLHLSVHSFVERLHGVERGNDVGLLYDPDRWREWTLARQLRAELLQHDLRVRCNFPYFGNTDGLASNLRRSHGQRAYLGIELEMNQRLARTPKGQQRLAAALAAALVAVVSGEPEGVPAA